jgi:hypothetical protein
MTEAKVHRCAHPNCRRFTLAWLCTRHNALQPEVAPEHQPHTERSACVDLVRPGPIAEATRAREGRGCSEHGKGSPGETLRFPIPAENAVT